MRAVHGSDLQVVLAVTGGGVAVVGDLLGMPGASRTVLEVLVPYAEASLADLVGSRPEQATSDSTARLMAEACLVRARDLAAPDTEVAGVACTAALATDRPKRGDHRAYVAVAYRGGLVERFVGLDKGELDRAGEDRVVSDVILDLIAEVAGVDVRIGA